MSGDVTRGLFQDIAHRGAKRLSPFLRLCFFDLPCSSVHVMEFCVTKNTTPIKTTRKCQEPSGHCQDCLTMANTSYLESTSRFTSSASPVFSPLTTFTCQPIFLSIHHSFTLSVQAKSILFNKSNPTLIDFFYPLDWTAFMIIGLDRTYHAHQFFLIFLF